MAARKSVASGGGDGNLQTADAVHLVQDRDGRIAGASRSFAVLARASGWLIISHRVGGG